MLYFPATVFPVSIVNYRDPGGNKNGKRDRSFTIYAYANVTKLVSGQDKTRVQLFTQCLEDIVFCNDVVVAGLIFCKNGTISFMNKGTQFLNGGIKFYNG